MFCTRHCYFICISSFTLIVTLWGINAVLSPSMSCHTHIYEFFPSFHYMVILPFSMFLLLIQSYNHRFCIDSNSLLVKEGNSLWKFIVQQVIRDCFCFLYHGVLFCYRFSILFSPFLILFIIVTSFVWITLNSCVLFSPLEHMCMCTEWPLLL